MDWCTRRQAGPTFHPLKFVLSHSLTKRNDHTSSSYEPNLLYWVVLPAGAPRSGEEMIVGEGGMGGDELRRKE